MIEGQKGDYKALNSSTRANLRINWGRTGHWDDFASWLLSFTMIPIYRLSLAFPPARTRYSSPLFLQREKNKNINNWQIYN